MTYDEFKNKLEKTKSFFNKMYNAYFVHPIVAVLGEEYEILITDRYNIFDFLEENDISYIKADDLLDDSYDNDYKQNFEKLLDDINNYNIDKYKSKFLSKNEIFDSTKFMIGLDGKDSIINFVSEHSIYKYFNWNGWVFSIEKPHDKIIEFDKIK